MSGKINVYGVGLKGVTVDKDPIELEDGELAQSQNATTDSVGAKGALRKRDGIAKFTTSVMAGAVKGISGLPLPNLANFTRHFYIGIDDGGGAATGSWRHSTDGTTWNTIAAAGPPAVPGTTQKIFPGATAATNALQGPWISLNNNLYYPGNDYLSPSQAPTMHRWDGTADFKLVSIPKNPYTTTTDQTHGILCVIPFDDHTLILTTADENPGGSRGRVLTMDTNSGLITHIGPQSDILGAGFALPYVPVIYQGKIWFSSLNTLGATASKVYWARLADKTWTRDPNGDTSTGNGYCLGAAVFLGDLYFGYLSDVGSNGLIRKRSTATGLYSTARICGSAAQYSGHGPLIVDPDGLKLYTFERQFAANTYKIISTTDGSTWTVEYDVGVNVGASFSESGWPVFDANKDLYWPVINGSITPIQMQTLKRTAAGTWSNVDNSNFHGRGQVMRISF